MDELAKINEWARNNLTNEMDFSIPFKEVMIELKSSECKNNINHIFTSSVKYLTIFENGMSDSVIKINRIGGLKYKQKVEGYISDSFIKNYNIYSSYTKEHSPELFKEIIEDQGGEDSAWGHAHGIVDLIFSIFAYILYHKQDLSELEAKEVKNSIKRKGRYVYDGTVRLEKTYVLKRIITHKEKLKRNITCDEWGVRGHMRHYQSGKVIFIIPYTKGKNRGKGKQKDKIYKITSGK